MIASTDLSIYPESYWRTVYPWWLPTRRRGYIALTDGWEARNQYSDVTWCTWCGYRNPAVMGRAITTNARAHRESCRGGELAWVTP